MGKLFERIEKKYILIIVASIGVFLFMKYMFELVFPFLLGTLFVIILNPLLNFIRKTTHIGKGISTGIILFFVGCIPGIILWFGITGFVKFSSRFPEIYNDIECNIYRVIEKYSGFLANSMDMETVEIENFIYSKINIIIEKMEVQIIPYMLNHSITYLKYVAIFSALWAITFIFSIMLAKDYESFKIKLQKQKSYPSFFQVANKVFGMIKMYAKAQLTIMTIITTIISTSLFFMGYSNAILFGIIIGVLDVLPFIGTGITLLPLAFWELINGNGLKALGVLILYGVCAFAREYLEPKLIGRKIGMHPLIMLCSFYLGVRLYGISGIITGPISVLIIIEIWREIKKIKCGDATAQT